MDHLLLVLELGQLRHLERGELLDPLVDLGLPAVDERIPVRVVEADPRQEDLEPLLDLGRVGHLVGGDVDVAVHDAVLDAEDGRDGEDAALVQPDRLITRAAGDHVERGHRLGEVHAVVEPEAALLLLAAFRVEEEVVRIHLLPALGARRSRHVVRALEAGLRQHLAHGLLLRILCGTGRARRSQPGRARRRPPPRLRPLRPRGSGGRRAGSRSAARARAGSAG